MTRPVNNRAIQLAEEHQHSQSVTYPTDISAPITLTGGAAANQAGSWTQIIAGGTLSSEYDVHYASIEVPANGTYGIEFSHGAGNTPCGELPPINRDAAVTSFSGVPVTTGDDDHQLIPPADALFARVRSAAGGAQTVDIFVSVHHYASA